MKSSNSVAFFIICLVLFSMSASALSLILRWYSLFLVASMPAFGLTSSEPLSFQVTYDSSQAPYPGSKPEFLLPIS